MLEDHTETSREKILHVYPDSYDVKQGTTEEYSLHDYKLVEKLRFNFKFSIKKILKKRSVSRKVPRSTREHTEFGKQPHKATCPNCLSYIKTETCHYNTGITHGIAASLIPICLCVIPYCTNKYKNTAHYCPKCKIYLGMKYGSGRNVLHCTLK